MRKPIVKPNNDIINVTCVDCGKLIVMSLLDYRWRYKDTKPEEIRCNDCQRKHFKEFLRQNPDVKEAFKAAVENTMGTPEKREKLADEIVRGWNEMIKELQKGKQEDISL